MEAKTNISQPENIWVTGKVDESIMYKGPFHITRMLLKCNLLCKEILSR